MPQESYQLRFHLQLPLCPDAPGPHQLDLPDGAILQRLAGIRQFGDPRQIISGWALLCARLLGLGWVGLAEDSLAVPQGLKTLEGLHRIEAYVDHRQAALAIEESILGLARAVASLLDSDLEKTVEPIRTEVHFHCQNQIQQGFLLPPPLAQSVLPRPAFDRIVDELRS